MASLKRQARVAGLWYLAMGLIAPIGLLYVPSQLIVRGDATATADRLRASESLMRIGIASELIHQALAIFLVLALYRLFKAVDHHQAVLVVILGALVSVPIVFANTLNSIAALILTSGADFLAVFEKPELDALAYLFLRMHSQGITVASIFWGLWLLPLGLLVMRSGFIPRVIGILLWVAGLAYVVDAFTSLLLPRYAPAVGRITLFMEMGELPIVFWLVVWGARERAAPAAATA